MIAFLRIRLKSMRLPTASVSKIGEGIIAGIRNGVAKGLIVYG